jgi:hypothetical protein
VEDRDSDHRGCLGTRVAPAGLVAICISHPDLFIPGHYLLTGWTLGCRHHPKGPAIQRATARQPRNQPLLGSGERSDPRQYHRRRQQCGIQHPFCLSILWLACRDSGFFHSVQTRTRIPNPHYCLHTVPSFVSSSNACFVQVLLVPGRETGRSLVGLHVRA